MPWSGRCRALVTLLATVACAFAQNGGKPRVPTFARVVDANGAPLAAAVVMFAGCLPHLGASVGPSDVQVVQADERGRAQAKLQGDLCYVAWATGPADPAGSGLRADPRGYFAAGGLIELVCDVPFAQRRVVVEGTEAWAAHGPLRFVVVTSSPGTETDLVLQDGALAMPPGPTATLEVHTADGQPLWTTSANSDTVVIPPPQRLRVAVVDENGGPLGGAMLRQRVGRRLFWRNDGLGGASEERMRELGGVGADGTAEIVVCHPIDPLREPSQQGHGELLLFASAPGRAPVAGGVFNNSFYVDDHKVARPPESVLRFTCRRAEPMAGNCGHVAEGTVAHLHAVCKLFSGANNYVHDARVFVVPVAANGAFVFEGVPAELHCCRLTLLPPAGAARLPMFPAMPGRELPPEVVVRAGAAPLGFEAFDLKVQVVDPTGGPARGGVAFLAPREPAGVLLRDAIVRFPLDARGAATLRVTSGTWAVMVVATQGWAVATQDANATTEVLRLTMQPLASMKVRLLDRDGAPIQGARPQLRGTATRGSGDPLRSLLQFGPTNPRDLWQTLRTDAEGRVQIPFVPVDGVTRRVALAWDGGMSTEFELIDDAKTTDVRPK